MQAKALKIADFSYHLPDEKIAQYPLQERDQSKLLIYKNGQISETIFNQLHQVLQPNDCLIFNDTKVIHARILFQKESGANIEIMCLEPFLPNEASLSFKTNQQCQWIALIGNNKKWKEGSLSKKIYINDHEVNLTVQKVKPHEDSFIVSFQWDGNFTFADIIQHAGVLPLPPYMNRDAKPEDEERYQTVYAKFEGSVAAPTAGLHFTKQVFEKLVQNHIQLDYVTLHVGAGTFKPVKASSMELHVMHEEHIIVEKQTIQNLLTCIQQKNRIIAVGTTSVRTIESLYWFGIDLLNQKNHWTTIDHIKVKQWQPYETQELGFNNEQILQVILDWMEVKKLNVLSGFTQIIIAPPYQLKLVDALITNFHQPESTLLLLVASVVGPNWKNVYEYALNNDFRFLSYGDSSILFKA